MKTFSTFFVLMLVSFLSYGDCHLASASPAPAEGGKDTVWKFSIGGGAAFSTINMRIEPIGEIKTGYSARASLRFKRRVAVMGEYTYQLLHGADPAWENIKSSNMDINLTYLYFNVGTSLTNFYAITGLCMQRWNGQFKGPAAVNQDNLDYKVGDFKAYNWTSGNLGIGFERNYNHLGLFGEFKFRFGKNQGPDPFGIVDVVLSLGAKLNFSLSDFRSSKKSTDANASPEADGSKSKPHSKGRKKFTIGPKIYHWF